ncbi:MAG TPA: glutaminyl-peptide cyclotransferase, partial [Vicinamibacterales bacterium]|nr:glutaminyl-peptide cyclotransferase [Vicinamibacterales bacterium]
MMKSRLARGALVLALAAGSLWLASSSVPELQAQNGAPVDTFRVVKAYPHDAAAYTQGLIYREGFLFESTGRHGQSTLRRVRLETGEVVQEHRLDAAYFGEGLAEWNGQL